ncbi:MAG: xanthine dehydrogenase family protein molybdopterin-binding subunit [Nitrososphaerota archaeon]|nr:xanthine dehydrogenase family protein molybdopterin-binding subunit [Nitrososphaerota archaeon]
MSQSGLIDNPNVVNRDIYARITGQRLYASDIYAKDIGASSMIYMGLVTAPYPRAKVTKLDVSKAQAAGFVTLVGSDLPAYDYFSYTRSYLPVTSDTVIYAGQPIAVVGAPTPNGVVDALNLIDVEYEALPYVFDPEDALKSTAPQLYPGGNSFTPPINISFGNVSTGFSQSDQVVEIDNLYAGYHQHFELEPVNTTAYWNNGVLYIWEKTNYVFGDQSTLAQYFGIPVSDVVVREAMGGTTNAAAGGMFGNATGADYHILAAAMAKKVGAPVKYVARRLDNALNSTARFPEKANIKVGGTKAGKLLAIQATMYYDGGARGGVIDGDDDLYTGYAVPNFQMDVYGANTNSYGAGMYMRDVGESQAHFILESAIDQLAQQLGIDPVTFRLNNIRTNPGAKDPVAGTPYAQINEPQTFQQAVDAFNWSAKWKGWGQVNLQGTKLTGVGVAYLNSNKGSAFPPSSAQIQVNPDGSVILYSGHVDQGAGTTTTIPIEGVSALGLTSFDNMTYYCGDTSINTDSSVTAGSQGSRNGGTAMIAAAKELGKQWFPIVAAKLATGTQASNLAFGNNTIYDTTNPSNSMSFKDAAALLTQPLKVSANATPEVLAGFAYTHRVTGAKLVEIQVDTETADVHIVNSVSSIDVGRILWYKGAYAQNEGGFIGLGIGSGLYEETIHDTTTGLPWSGGYLNPNFNDNKVPTIMETPDNHTPIVNESVPDPTGPFGAKGMGEPSLCATSAAIANALSNALGGYRFSKTPIRREDIVAALEWMQQNGKL